jgi:hypothetical protein
MPDFLKRETPVPEPKKEQAAGGALECWGAVPDHTRKRHYPNAESHPATEFVALRTGSYTARVCKRCVKSDLSKTYSGGPWWTRAGCCAVCGIEVYLNPSETMKRERHPETKLLCSSTCGRTKRLSSRAATRAAQEAELQAEQERAEACRKERQRTDELIAELWPEEEAFK